jgi:hypothetical protein
VAPTVCRKPRSVLVSILRVAPLECRWPFIQGRLRGEGSAAGPQLRTGSTPAALLSQGLHWLSRAFLKLETGPATDQPRSPLTCLPSATNRHCWRSSEPVLMQRRSPSSQVLLCCAVLCCCALCCSAPAPSLMHYSPLPWVVASGRSCVEGGG